MTGPAEIPKGHHGLVWLFAVDLPKASLPGFVEETLLDDDTSAWPLREALGGVDPDPDFIEAFDVETVKDYGLRRYLTEANGLSAAQVDADAAMLDVLTGPILLIFSNALPDGPVTFAPAPPLRLLARYGTDPMIPSMGALPADGARGVLTPPPTKVKSDARIGGMVALVALLIAFALVAYIVWSAG